MKIGARKKSTNKEGEICRQKGDNNIKSTKKRGERKEGKTEEKNDPFHSEQ
jgi:hypothetical protein